MKHNKVKISEYKKELIEVFLQSSKDKKLFTEFLHDILTPAEFEAMSLRWQIVKRLQVGEDQRKIAGELSLGISTVTRGSRELRNKQGGFALMLKKTGNIRKDTKTSYPQVPLALLFLSTTMY